jgi:hypothetical protein
MNRMEPDCCGKCRCGAGDPCCDEYRFKGAVTRYSGATSLRGDDDAKPSLRDQLDSPTVKTAAAVAMTYHGYKRTGSILWALLYGLAGKTVPLIAVPVAAAQGFGKKKEGC